MIKYENAEDRVKRLEKFIDNIQEYYIEKLEKFLVDSQNSNDVFILNEKYKKDIKELYTNIIYNIKNIDGVPNNIDSV